MPTDPPWVLRARAYIGVRETPGPKNNPAISGWLAKLGGWWRDDATPWCGTFLAYCFQECDLSIPKNWFRAKDWAGWGDRTTPRYGSVLVFGRTGGGHVALYTGENRDHFRCLGGNQGDAVCETWIAKDRLLDCRWPQGVPVTTAPYVLTMAGKASVNEA